MTNYDDHRNLTDTQAIIINSIMDFYQNNQSVPCYRELALLAGLPSKQMAYVHVRNILRKEGLYIIPLFELRRLRARRRGYQIGPRSLYMIHRQLRIYVPKINQLLI